MNRKVKEGLIQIYMQISDARVRMVFECETKKAHYVMVDYSSILNSLFILPDKGIYLKHQQCLSIYMLTKKVHTLGSLKISLLYQAYILKFNEESLKSLKNSGLQQKVVPLYATGISRDIFKPFNILKEICNLIMQKTTTRERGFIIKTIF